MAGGSDSVYEPLEPLLATFAGDNHVPGCVLGVVHGGRLAWLKCLGVREVGADAPVTPASVFRIASMTKMVTALGCLHLRDRGLLAFDEPVDDIVPELKSLRYPTRDSRRIRVRDLLSHTAGFVTDDPWGDRQLDMSDAAFSALLSSDLPFAHPPGTAFEYSNLGFAILGRVIASRAGQPYDAYMQAHLLQPLDMAASGWEVRDVPTEHRARGYSWIDDEWVGEPVLSHGAFGAMGGLHTSATDYARFVAWLLSAWPPRDDPDDPILARASIRELAQGIGFPQLQVRADRTDPLLSDTARRYGLGIIALADPDLGPCLTHSGGLPGYGSNVLLLPERDLGVFLFANVTYPHPSAAATVRQAALRLAECGEFPPRPLKPLPTLLGMEEVVRGIYAGGDILTGADAFAGNLLLDRRADLRNRDLAGARRALGAIIDDATLTTESAMAGTFTYRCEGGRLRVRVLLAPTVPPTIQKLEFAVDSTT
jgi:CubicO group peptidase (beta-lactamase class C family)